MKFTFPKVKFPSFSSIFAGKKKVKSATGDYMVKSSYKPKQKVNKLLTNFLRYLVLLTITIFFFIVGYIALPMTEKLYSGISFDLVEKDYVSKSYILELKIKREDTTELDSKINKTMRIISKRLYQAGAQQVSVTGYHGGSVTPDDAEYLYRQIQVKVVGSVDELDLDQLVYVRSYLRFYTFKDGVTVNEEDENDLSQYLPQNYEASEFTRYDFRNIYIKRTVDDNGVESYQAIYKSWPFDGRFEDFISENAGKKIGIGGLDYSGAIIPLDLPITYSKSIRETIGEPFLFSLTLSGEKRQAEITDIQLNSGVIPLEYSVVSQSPVEREANEISHIFLAASILVIIIGFTIFNKVVVGQKSSEVVVKSFAVLITFATFFAIFKFFLLPLDLSLMFMTSILFIIAVYIVAKPSYDNNDYLFTLLMLAGAWLISFGVVKEIAFTLMMLITLHVIIRDLVRYYIINMSKFITND